MEESEIMKRACGLFRENVPEVAADQIEIKRLAWLAEAGVCVAVVSRDPKVDALGACVRPPRPANIMRALGQGPLTIIRWSEDVREFIAASIPAPKGILYRRVSPPKVILREEGRKAKVVVDPIFLEMFTREDEKKLELMSKLVGWKLELSV